MTTATYATAEVFAPGLSALTNKVAELNKRAARHGMDMMAVQVVRVKQFVRIRRPDPAGPVVFSLPVDLFVVEITGCAPRIDGWALVARVEFNDVVGNVVRIVPGVCDDGSFVSYRAVGPVCEHCNSIRNRNDIFVLEHSDGRRKLVGRNCLADFLRCDDANAFVRLAEYADLASQWAREASDGCYDSEGYEGGLGFVRTMPLARYLPVVAMLMRRIGWTGRTKSKETDCGPATADLAYTVCFPRSSYDKAWIEKSDLHANEDDAARAACAIDWVCTVDDGGSEYLHTIKQIALAGVVDFKGLDGYAASIIVAYKNACERDAERAEKAKGAKSKVYFGSEGIRSKGVKITCKGIHTFEGHYGVTTIVRFEHSVSDTEKAVIVWFASGDKSYDWKADAEYTVDFTVKGHDDDPKYGKQTKVNRVSCK
jgi:hypothetical protein